MSDTPRWTPPDEGPRTDAPSPRAGGGAPPGPSSGWSAGWSAPAPPWRADAKPGVVPLRPLAVGEILDGAFTMIRREPRLTLGLAAGVVVVELVVTALVGALLGDVGAAFGVRDLDALAAGGFTAVGTLPGLVSTLVAAVLGAVYTGMVTVIVGEAVLGRTSTLRSVWDRVRPRAAALLGAALAAGLLPWVGLLAFVVGGVFLWGALALTMPALVLERCGVGQALRRSWRLAVPDWWRVFGVRTLATVIAWVVTTVLVLPASVVALVSIVGSAGDDAGTTGVLGPALLTLATAVASVVTMPFTAGV
ncbi:MAG: hypothetical protein ACM3ZF_07075, partial [Mycobacterium leprae]